MSGTMDTNSKDKLMIAPEGKGFTVFRGDTGRLEKGKIKGVLYDIGKSLRPSIGRSWTTSYKTAKIFACTYAEGTNPSIVPVVFHGVTRKAVKGLFWDLENEVHIVRDKSKLKNVEVISRSECDKIMKELRSI